MKKLFLPLLLVFLTTVVRGQLLINEYSASNINLAGTIDYEGEYNDVMELFNTTGTAVNLNGYYFSDDANNPTKWQCTTNVFVPANGLKLIHCSGNDTITPGGEVHTDFKLTQCKNEQVLLVSPAGVIIDSMTLIRTKRNNSIGRATNGAATWRVFTTPSFNAANTGGFLQYTPRPIMSLAPGHYNGAQTLTLTAPTAGDQIRYTTNGLAPTITSTLYTAPIAIDSTMIIRAACFSSNAQILQSFTETNTFFINENHAFAIISLGGTYTGAGGLFQTSNDIINSCEYFDDNKNFKWEYEGTTRRHGNDSWQFAQKGMGFEVLDEFGYLSEMPEAFFSNTPRDKFQKIILKAAGSDNYPGSPFAPTRTYAHMRDAMLQTYTIKHNLNVDERSAKSCVVYINGRYWGIYEIRERVDNDYTDYYYNQSKKYVDMIQYWGGTNVNYGSDTGWNNLDAFITNNSMTVPANYNYVESKLDLLSFIDYFVINTWAVNTDWLNWNTMWWRGRKGAGVKWRYCLWDMDNTFDLGEDYTGIGNTGASSDPCVATTLFQNSQNIEHTRMLSRLLQNPNFEQMYKNRYAYLVSNVFICDSVIAHLDRYEQMLLPEMPQHVARWGGSVADWQSHVDSIRQFILLRCTVVGGANDTCFNIKKLKYNVDPPLSGNIVMGGANVSSYYPYEATLPGDSFYSYKAVPNPGFEFVEWRKYEATNTLTPSTTDSIINFRLMQKDSLVAVFRIDLPDTFNVVINAIPAYGGTVTFDGNVISTFPTVLQIVENTNHTLKATPTATHTFNNWTHYNSFNNSIAPNLDSANITFSMKKAADTITANFDTLIIILPPTVFVPNAFTPNGDGRNDWFGLITKDNDYLTQATMRVFNRWGEEIYNGNSLNTGWDGKYKGEIAEGGTYYYHMLLTHKDGTTEVFSGNLVLVR